MYNIKTLKNIDIDDLLVRIIFYTKCNVCGGKMELLKESQNIVDLQNTSECVKRNQIYSSVKSRYACA